jgi:two-component system response regulator YesN
MEKYMSGVAIIQKAQTLREIKNLIEKSGFEIADMNAPESAKIYSTLIRETIGIIDENIENENLSLRWLAGTILYTNVDYLGKLFKKETGKNFSHYVMEKRMERAKDLILEGKKDRIYEVAEKVGYGSNSQYFSQVFKKYTGVSPLEYKEFARLEREKLIKKTS